MIAVEGDLHSAGIVALSRVLVPRSRRQEITDALIAQMRQIRIGDPFDEATVMGPLATAAQRNRVESFIRIGCEESATLALGGGRPAGFEAGYPISPTLFCDATNRMKIAREEIFGPCHYFDRIRQRGRCRHDRE